MEILKRGTPPPERVYEAVCRVCETEFRFQRSEGKVEYDQRDGNFIQICCPVCGQPVALNL